MALTSASTQADALAQYNDNLLWEGDLTKAQNLLEAVRWLIGNRAWEVEEASGRRHKLDQERLGDMEKELSSFVSSNLSTVNTIRVGDVSGS